MAELEDARGQNPRKRVRGSAHVPVYGDAKWTNRPRNARLIGSVDLGEARGTLILHPVVLEGRD